MKLLRRREESLDNEVRDYLDRETGENIAAGMSPEEARLAARRKLGPELRVKEDTRAAWGLMWLERLWQDLRHGLHMLRKNPSFAIIAIVSISFGTGANVAMFSTIDAWLLRPLPVARPHDVITVGSVFAVGHFRMLRMSYRDLADVRARSKSFASLVGYTDTMAGFSARPGETPQLKSSMLVSGDLFRVLGVEPELGRSFAPEEDSVPGRDAVVVLSHGLWQQEFAADPAVLGRTVRIAGIDFKVIGVAPERFTGLNKFRRTQFYMPLAMWPRLLTPGIRLIESAKNDPLLARDYRDLTVKGLLNQGVSLTQARAEITGIAKDLERAYPATNKNQGLNAETELEVNLRENLPHDGLFAILAILSTAVLIVACANVAGLLTSRAPVRAREIAVRLAIGAGRARLIRQLFTESLILASSGAVLGLAVGYAGILLLRQEHYASALIAMPSIDLDRRAMIFSLVVAFLSALLFGLGPAIQTTRTDLIRALKAGGGSGTSRPQVWGRNLLVATQVAISLCVLTLAAYTYQYFHKALTESPGFRTDRLLMMRLDPTLARYSSEQSQQFIDKLTERVRRTPGVRSVTTASAVPMVAVEFTPIQPDGYRLAEGEDAVWPLSSSVDEDYFDTMAVPLLHGRGFLTSDTKTAAHVAVVNETLAAHYWPGQNAIGKSFRKDGDVVEIVGIAKGGTYMYPGEPPEEMVYFPRAQQPRTMVALLAHSAADSASLIAPLREVIRDLDPNMPVFDVETVEFFYTQQGTSENHVFIGLVLSMGLMGLTLAMAGLYGLMSYSVSRRTREIGIRMAVGANTGSVLRMILGQGTSLALGGLAAGVVMSVLAIRVIPRMVPNSFTFEPGTAFAVAPALLIVAMFAAFVPARRAARVDPMTALRDE
jgi:predicted permease